MFVEGFEIDKKQRQKEKEKARLLRRSPWWKQQISRGLCFYCGSQFPREELTMDHKVPIARGGRSTKGNVVVSCKTCNSEKKYFTPAEMILKDLNS